MPCYRAESNHYSAPETQPGTGASWTTYWKECPCCSDSSASPSSSPSSSPSASPSAGSSSSASPAAFSAKIIANVPDWNQPAYYQTQGLIPGTPISNPPAEGGAYVSLSSTALKAWCAPAAAACQLGHIRHNASHQLPAFGNDNIDAGNDANPSLSTVGWNSSRAWGDYMLDGPIHRQERAVTPSDYCKQADFGWWMDTNGAGVVGAQNYTGTTLGLVYNGLNKFYLHLGVTNAVGMAYHLPRNGSTLTTMGVQPYSNNTNADLSQVWSAIKTTIDAGRTVVATTMLYELNTYNSHANRAFTSTSAQTETHADYYVFGASGATGPTQPNMPRINGAAQDATGEAFTWEVYDANGIGHTVLIVGYIEAGSADDVSVSTDTDWIIVRDNLENSHRNVCLPSNKALTGGWSLWDVLLSTCYVNVTTPVASYSVQCSIATTSSSSSSTSTSPSASGTTNASSSSSSSASVSGGGGQYNQYIAYPCVGSDWTSTSCANWYALSGGIEIEIQGFNEGSSTLYNCVQTNGGTIQFKICRVDGVNALGTGAVCCLLIVSGSTLSNPYVATSTGNPYQDCYNCNLNLTQSD